MVAEATESQAIVVEVAGKKLTLSSIRPTDISDWTGEARFRFWKCHLQFVIFVDNSEPSVEQLEYLGRLMTSDSLSRSEIERLIFQHYVKFVAPQSPVDWEGKPLPVARSLRQFCKTIHGPTVYIDRIEGGVPACSLEFEADWDVEHGMIVRLADCQAETVGF